jgi:ADP-ribosylglycohydrolase
MKGAIIGDIIGSVYEHAPVKHENFRLFTDNSTFTDDTVLTVASAYAILYNTSYASAYKLWGRKYPDAGYGGLFKEWIDSKSSAPYNSWGNGAAMRVSPIAWAFNKLEEVQLEAIKSASVTHDHPEGIKGALAVATAVFLARCNKSKIQIQEYISQEYKYNLLTDYEKLRQDYRPDVSAQGSVPQAIVAFLASADYEDCVRKAVALGGDSDTQACIAGAIAQAFYREIPRDLVTEAHAIIPGEMLHIMVQFNKKYRIELKQPVIK